MNNLINLLRIININSKNLIITFQYTKKLICLNKKKNSKQKKNIWKKMIVKSTKSIFSSNKMDKETLIVVVKQIEIFKKIIQMNNQSFKII